MDIVGRLIKVCCILLVGFSVSYCTRDVANVSQLSFSLKDFSQAQKISAQSTADSISFLAVNVKSAEGTFKCTLDSDGAGTFDNSICIFDPTNLGIILNQDFQAGQSVFIQVLLIEEFEDSEGVEMEFFSYGDDFVQLSANDNVIAMSVQPDLVSSGAEGVVSGRYLVNGAAHSGTLVLEYVPTSRPDEPMEIFDFEMFNGFFEIYVFDNIQLQYRYKPTGDYLFDGPVTSGSPQFQSGSAEVANLSTPVTYYNNDSHVESNRAINLILGFWNDGLPDVGNQVRVDSTAVTAPYTYIDAAATIPLQWPNDFAVIGGSALSISNPLVSSTEMSVNGAIMTNGGGSGRLFHGPFMKYEDSGEYEIMHINTDGSDVVLNWKYLPGVAGDSVAGSTVFYKISEVDTELQDEHDGGQGFDCNQLVDNYPGWSFIDVDHSVETLTISGFTPADLSSGKIFVCPRRFLANDEGSFFYRSILETNRNYSGDGGSSGPMPAIEIVLENEDTLIYPYINNGTCTKVDLIAMDSEGAPGSLPNYPYTISLSQAEGGFYSDPVCSSSISGGIYNMTHSYDKIWYRATTDIGNAAWTANTHFTEAITLTGASISIPVQTANPANHLDLDLPSSAYTTDDCVSLTYILRDSNGVPTNYGGSLLTITQTIVGGNGTLHNNGDCSSAGANVNISTSQAYTFGSFVPIAAELSLTLTMTNSPESFPNYENTIDIIDPGAANYARAEGVSDLSQDVCSSFIITTFGNNVIPNYSSPKAFPTSNLSFNLSATNGANIRFFANAGNCGADTPTMSNSGVFSTGINEMEIYYRTPDSGGSFEIVLDELNFGDAFDFTSDTKTIAP